MPHRMQPSFHQRIVEPTYHLQALSGVFSGAVVIYRPIPLFCPVAIRLPKRSLWRSRGIFAKYRHIKDKNFLLTLTLQLKVTSPLLCRCVNPIWIMSWNSDILQASMIDKCVAGYIILYARMSILSFERRLQRIAACCNLLVPWKVRLRWYETFRDQIQCYNILRKVLLFNA